MRIRYLIARLVLLVVLRVHLVTVIGQVNVLVLVAERVRVGTRTKIARFVAEEVLLAVHECEHAYIELTALEQQRPLNIFLNNDTLAFLLGAHETE